MSSSACLVFPSGAIYRLDHPENVTAFKCMLCKVVTKSGTYPISHGECGFTEWGWKRKACVCYNCTSFILLLLSHAGPDPL